MARETGRLDAVRLMRSIRNRLSKEFAGLSFAEQHRRIQVQLRIRKPPNRRFERTGRDTGRHGGAS